MPGFFNRMMLILAVLFIGSGMEASKTYTPVLMARNVLEKSIKWIDARELERPGKIYRKGDYLFINEKYRGIHVVDNSDPASPSNVGFIQVPGCIDMAVKGSILYADNAVDLVAIDISTPENMEETARVKNVFPEIAPPGTNWIPYEFQKENRPENTVIIEWIKLE